MKKLADYRAIVLDRDGVINHDSDEYIKSAEEWMPIAGSIEAIATLKKMGLVVCVCSNQSGIGRGFFALTALHAMHHKLHTLLVAQDVAIDRLYFCPHHPDDNCQCRKPGVAMLQAMVSDFGLSAADMLFIGDTKSDYLCAQQMGCDFALVATGKGKVNRDKVPGEIRQFENLSALVTALS